MAGVEFESRFYAATQNHTTDIGEPVTGVVQPGCNDTGGTSEPDIPMHAYQVSDYCTTDVLAVGDGDSKTVYVRMR